MNIIGVCLLISLNMFMNFHMKTFKLMIHRATFRAMVQANVAMVMSKDYHRNNPYPAGIR